MYSVTQYPEERVIHQCLRQIESQLGWGEGETWTNYDFEKLGEAIWERTGVRLSVTTLKRIWGRLKYDNVPTLTTLNTLARFAGYTDWRTFKQQHTLTEVDEITAEELLPQQETASPAALVRKRRSRYYWLLLGLALVPMGYFFISSRGKTYSAEVDPSKFGFKVNKMVTEGVPNSVIFEYNASAAKTDSVFIVQTWDMRRKKLVSKHKHQHSAQYYYPGFFRTKLIADGQIVKTHDLWITSGGWLCLVEDEPAPLYFKQEEYLKPGRVEIDKNTLQAYNLSLHPKPPRIRFFNQRDMGDLASDNFTFETVLKNDFNEGSNTCQNVEVLIQCKDDIIIIPLGAKACVGDMRLAFCGYWVESQDADLSGFGCNLTQWTKLRVETVNKVATLYVNGKKAYSLTFPNDAAGIVGVQYRFNGVGAVKDTWFSHEGIVTRL